MSIEQQMENIKDYVYAKGYDEPSLSSPEKKGAFLRHLKEAVRSFDSSDETTSSDTVALSVEAIGLFNGASDIVHFDFNFLYHPAAETIVLDNVSGRINGNKTPVTFNSEELPAAREFYETLSIMESHSLANRLLRHTTPQQSRAKRI